MNSLFQVEGSLSLQVVVTLFHFLWQGLALAILVAICNATIARNSAKAKYAVSFSALMLMLACMIGTFGIVAANATPVNRTVVSATEVLIENEPSYAEAVGEIALEPESFTDEINVDVASAFPVAISIEETNTEPSTTSFLETWAWLAPYVVIVYLVGVALMIVRFAGAFYGGDRLRRRAVPVTKRQWLNQLDACIAQIECSIRPKLMTCERIATPLIVGVFKPVILLPASLLTEMTPAQIEAILLHELAHLRRLDHVANLIQRVVETLLFFHPAVWYVSGRVSAERENCCDDLVLSIGAEPAGYAETLLRVAELGQRRNRLAAATLAVEGDHKSQLRTRVSRVMGIEDKTPFRSSRWAALTVLTLLSLSTVGLWSQLQASSASPKNEESEVNDEDERDLAEFGTSVGIAVSEVIRTAKLPFVDEGRLKEIEKEFARYIDTELPTTANTVTSLLSDEQKTLILSAVETHGAKHLRINQFRQGDLRSENLAYLNLPDRLLTFCLLYTSPSPRDQRGSRMPSSA